MNIDRWLSLPSSLKWRKPNPDDYSDEDSYTDAFQAWLRDVEDYELACDRAVDAQRDREAMRGEEDE